MATEKEIASQILEAVGGKDNVGFLTHCVTRLRFELKDKSLADGERIKHIPEVIGIQDQNGQYQVIIGQNVMKVYDELQGLLGPEGEGDRSVGKGGKRGAGYYVQWFASVFTPIIPALVGTALIEVVNILLRASGILAPESTTYQVFEAIGNTALVFLPILVAISTAEKVGCNKYVAVAVVATTITPAMTALMAGDTPVTVMGLPITSVSYSNQVIPALLAVLLYAKLEKFFRTHLPENAMLFSFPISVFITAIVTFVVLGPLGYYIGYGFSYLLLFVNDHASWLVSGLIGALCPFLIMIGAHWALIPIALQNLGTLGYDPLLAPGFLTYNVNLGAAALAVAIRTRDKQLKSVSISSAITAFLGITEPALYGVALKFRKVLVAAVVGGFFGGCYLGFTHVVGYAWYPALLGISGYFGDTTASIVNAFVGTAIGFAITFIMSWFGYEPTEQETA